MSEIRKGPACGGAGERSEQVQGHPARNEAEIERMRDRLAELLFPEDGGELDEEALDALLDRMEEVSPLPASLATDPAEALERFRRRYAPLLAEEGAGGTPGEASAAPEKRRCSNPLVKALPIAAALVLLLGTVTAQALGVDVFSAVARWTAEIFRLDGGSTPYAAVELRPLEVGEEASYESLEEAVEAFGIDAPIVPREIPERFELVEVKAVQRKLGVLIYANYESGGEVFQVRYNEAEMEESTAVERENDFVDSCLTHGINHYLLMDMGREKAVWQNGEFECCLFGDVSEKEMKDIIYSIY